MRPLILLHGFPFDSTLWAPVRADLPADWPVFAPDLPGFGAEPPLPAPTMDALADWLAEWMTDRGLPEAVVAGHSMGGYVALAFVGRYPGRARGLGLLHSTAAPDLPEKRTSRDDQIAHVRAHGTARLAPKLVLPLVAEANATWLQPVLGEFVAKATALPAPTIAALIGAMRDRPDRRAVLAAAAFPVLMVAGAHDAVVPPATARAQLATVPEAAKRQLVTIADAGHLGMLEAPAAIGTALAWLMKAAA